MSSIVALHLLLRQPYSIIGAHGFPHALRVTNDAVVESMVRNTPDSFQIDNSSRSYPLVLRWTWLNHLPFVINKQKRSDAIQEDEINEP